MKELLESIKHWKKNLSLVKKRKYDEMGLGFAFCPLCKKYYFGNSNNCKNCPICLKTGQTSCRNTPYKAVYEYYCCIQEGCKVHDKLLIAVKSEIEFLKGLL